MKASVFSSTWTSPSVGGGNEVITTMIVLCRVLSKFQHLYSWDLCVLKINTLSGRKFLFKKSFPVGNSSALLVRKSYWMVKAATELIPPSCHLWRPKSIGQNDKKTQTNDRSAFVHMESCPSKGLEPRES